MIKGLYTVARSLDFRTKNIELIANNLANINTTGYKREIPFSEYLNESGGVDIKKISNMDQGETILTSNPLDLMIDGKGFFTIQNEDGSMELTRDGRFKINEEGFLTDSVNRKVMGKNGAISLEDTLLTKDSKILISPEGEVRVGDKIIDSLSISNVDMPEELVRTSGSNFIAEDGTIIPATINDFKVVQGYIEESNTNPLIEMEQMISVNKSFESAQKIISALDKSLDDANQIGKV
ncbi:MAG: flagellar hook basal-body protein [Ignavibacteriaceae bacterium]|jgi:flagellar basal-body rod protein FlgG|nr:flagellar hook basal-body protein [Ignavibacteriaceae bacterium]